jgi:hypothetical protein
LAQTTKDVTESVVVTDTPLKSAEASAVSQGSNALAALVIWNYISNVSGQGSNALAALTVLEPVKYWVY